MFSPGPLPIMGMGLQLVVHDVHVHRQTVVYISRSTIVFFCVCCFFIYRPSFSFFSRQSVYCLHLCQQLSISRFVLLDSLNAFVVFVLSILLSSRKLFSGQCVFSCSCLLRVSRLLHSLLPLFPLLSYSHALYIYLTRLVFVLHFSFLSLFLSWNLKHFYAHIFFFVSSLFALLFASIASLFSFNFPLDLALKSVFVCLFRRSSFFESIIFSNFLRSTI